MQLRRVAAWMFVTAAAWVGGTDESYAGQWWEWTDRDWSQAQVTYEKGRPLVAVFDFDGNGIADIVVHYRGGYRDRAWIDRDQDGHPDAWVDYYFTGPAWRVSEDFNRDDRPDYWMYLLYWKDGSVYRWEQDTDYDGKPDLRTLLRAGARGARTLRQTADEDKDGVYDRSFGLNARPPQAPPASHAEALLGSGV